jgi:hypothetical protein
MGSWKISKLFFCGRETLSKPADLSFIRSYHYASSIKGISSLVKSYPASIPNCKNTQTVSHIFAQNLGNITTTLRNANCRHFSTDSGEKKEVIYPTPHIGSIPPLHTVLQETTDFTEREEQQYTMFLMISLTWFQKTATSNPKAKTCDTNSKM